MTTTFSCKLQGKRANSTKKLMQDLIEDTSDAKVP